MALSLPFLLSWLIVESARNVVSGWMNNSSFPGSLRGMFCVNLHKVAPYSATSLCARSAAIQISRWRTRWVLLLILLLHVFWCFSSFATIVLVILVLISLILRQNINNFIHHYILGSFRWYGRCSIKLWR